MALALALAVWTKTLTLAITFKPEEVGLVFILNMCIPCVTTFHMVP